MDFGNPLPIKVGDRKGGMRGNMGGRAVAERKPDGNGRRAKADRYASELAGELWSVKPRMDAVAGSGLLQNDLSITRCG